MEHMGEAGVAFGDLPASHMKIKCYPFWMSEICTHGLAHWRILFEDKLRDVEISSSSDSLLHLLSTIPLIFIILNFDC